MKKITGMMSFRKLTVSVVMFVFLLCLNAVPSQAAVPSISTSKYIKAIASSKIYVYTSSSLKTPGTASPYKAYTAYVSSGDEIYIYKWTDSYCYISYPTSSGRKRGYVATSSLSDNNFSASALISRASIKVYKKIGGAQYGTIYQNDSVYAVARSGNYTQVIYPAGTLYKMGWVSNTNYNNYLAANSLTEKSISSGKYYVFYSAVGSKKVMDVNGNYLTDGTNIQLYDANSTNAQKFKVTKLSSGWYSIINVNGKAIDVQGGTSGSGVNVQLYTYNGTDAQLWKFYDAGNGYYYIKNKLGYYLDVNGGSTANSTNIQVYSLNYSSAQKWKLTSTSTSSATYYVTTTAGLVLRKSASTSAKKLTTIPYGTAITVTSFTTSGWAKGNYAGQTGYCSIQYLSPDKPTTSTSNNDSNSSSVTDRLNLIKNGSLTYNSSTVLTVGKKYVGYLSGEQCKGYAKVVFYLCFKVWPSSTKDNNYQLNSKSGMTCVGSLSSTSASNLSTLFAKARPGDFVQMRRSSSGGPHSAIVYSVSSGGVTFLEANLDGNNAISMNYYTWSKLCQKNSKLSLYTATDYSLK